MGLKYHTSLWCGHGTAIINIGQPFDFADSYSAPVAYFSKRSANPPWHNGHIRTDIAEFGPVPTKTLLIKAQ